MTQVALPETNERAVMGDNRPPLSETVLMEFDANLREHDGLIERIEEMVAKAGQAKPCDNDHTAGKMGDFIKMTSAVVKLIEAEREVVNRPLIDAGRALKARADNLSVKAKQAGETVREHLDKYLDDKRKAEKAEADRLAAIARQAEAERQRVIQEAEAKARQEAEDERRRLQAIADAEAAKERDRLQAIEDERAAREQREAAAVEVVAEVVEVEVKPVFVPEPEPVFVSQAPVKAPVRGDYGSTIATTETWDVKVDNIRQVPDVFLRSPAVIEALEKVIRPQVRGKNGLRDIKGCTVFSTIGSSVR
jgi:hypothetical protein